MSSISEKEKLALDDVFLSISKSHEKSHKLDAFSHLQLYSKSWLELKYASFKHFKISELIAKSLNVSKMSLDSAKSHK